MKLRIVRSCGVPYGASNLGLAPVEKGSVGREFWCGIMGSSISSLGHFVLGKRALRHEFVSTSGRVRE